MNHDDLALRQQRLLMRSAELRADWAHQVQGLKGPLVIADQARAGLQWLARNPAWPLGCLLVLIVVRPGRALVWGGRLWWAWGMYRRADHWISNRP